MFRQELRRKLFRVGMLELVILNGLPESAAAQLHADQACKTSARMGALRSDGTFMISLSSADF